MNDEATDGWTYIFEAYCLSRLERYSEAIAQQVTGMNLIERSDPLDYYNLACFNALGRNEEAALRNLERAIELGGELYRKHAAKDPDITLLREAGKLEALIGTDVPEGEAP